MTAAALTVDVGALDALWNARLTCEEDGCTLDAEWRCSCPFDGCGYAILLCGPHHMEARAVVLELLSKPTGFVGCPQCGRKYPKQGPFRRWVHL